MRCGFDWHHFELYLTFGSTAVVYGYSYYNTTKGALVTVTINKFALPVQDIKTKAELDLSGKGLGVEDAIILAALIPLNVSRAKRCPTFLLWLLILLL